MNKDSSNGSDNQTITVKEGDSWASLSAKVYGSPGYADLLATYNGLNKFRKPVAGSQIVFPPLTDL